MGQRDTLETSPATTVLVVGGPTQLVDCATRAAAVVPMAAVVSCELRDAPTKVAELWPFVIIMSDDLYAFDSAEFDALARDVNATLLKIDMNGMDAAKLERALMPKLGRAHRRKR